MKLKIYIVFIFISGICYSQSPYDYLGDQSKTLQAQQKGKIPIITLLGVMGDSNVIVTINYRDRVFRYKNLVGEYLLSDTIKINSKAFLSIDPKAEEMPWVSPYSYCFGNPISMSDPTGCSPIYSSSGEFLGTDDHGLKGDYYIMSDKDFVQGMSFDDVKNYSINPSDLSEEIIENIKGHYNSLPERPDYDGYLTLKEANEWYQKGNGQSLFVDLEKIDLTGIVSLGENYVGQEGVFNLLINSVSLNDGLVYGNIKLKRYPNHTVRAYSDKYDFDIKSWQNPMNWGRNIETIIGSKVAGQGTPFNINIYGSKKLTPILPWIK